MKFSIFLISLIFLISINTSSQSVFKTKCEAVKFLINSNEVSSWFRNFAKPSDSLVYFLDPNNLLDSCTISTWKNYPVQIINKGELIDSLKVLDFHFMVKRRFNFYQLRESSKNNEIIILFHRGYDNLSTNIRLTKKKNRYSLKEISSGVF